MKKILTSLLLVLVLTLSFTACGREKVNIANAKSIHDLKGATIAAQSATFHLDVLDQIKDDITIKAYPDFTTLLNALSSGAVDGYVSEEPTAYAECLKDDRFAYLPFVNNETGFTATEEDTGIAVALKKGSAMRATVDEIIAGVSRETKNNLMKEVVDICADRDKNVDKQFSLVSTNTDRSKGTLKVAMECAYDPFNWTQTTDANGAVKIANATTFYANGYDVQFAKYIAAELGMNLEVYKYQWDGLITAVQSGAVDCIMAGMSPTPERKEVVDFTQCYYTSNLVIIYKK